MSTGWELRLGILRQDAESELLAPLRTHGWTASIEREVERGEYLVIKAERAGVSHRVAIMYTSATDNAVYKALAPQVEHIFIKGELYKLDSYAYGITTPVSTANDFHSVLIGWNNDSATGKFAPHTSAAPIAAHPPKHRTLLSEQPIEAIWLRLRQLTSVSLARKLVTTRAANEGVLLDDEVARTKAEGLAFSLRNAAKATRRIKFDRNKSVEADLTFWASFLGRGAETMNVGDRHVDDLLIDMAFLTVEVPEIGLIHEPEHQYRMLA